MDPDFFIQTSTLQSARGYSITHIPLVWGLRQGHFLAIWEHLGFSCWPDLEKRHTEGLFFFFLYQASVTPLERLWS